MFRLAFFLFTALLAQGVSEDFYIAQNAVGGGDGTTCANAFPLSWLNTGGNWGAGIGKISGGDAVHLCGIMTSPASILGDGVAGNPITLTAEPGAKFSNKSWSQDVVSGAAARSWIVVDGLTIEATSSGTGQSQGGGTAIGFPSGCNNCEVRRNVIHNLYARTAGSGDRFDGPTGIFIANGSNVKIYGNTIDNARYTIFYGYPGGVVQSNLQIFDNVLSQTAGCIIVASGDTNAVINGVKIYGNSCKDMSPWGGYFTGCSGDCWFHCDGIHAWAVHSGARLNNLEVYNNSFGGPSCTTNSGSSMTAWFYLEGKNGGILNDTLVYNNIVEGAIGTDGSIVIGAAANPKVFNNVVVGPGAGVGTGGIRCWNCTSPAIKNNLVGNLRSGITLAGVSGATINNNAYFGLHSVNQFENGSCCTTFSGWRNAGYDANAIMDTLANLKVDSQWRPLSGSPLIDAGSDVSAMCPGCALDRSGSKRPQGPSWDIGAYEGTGQPRPEPPVLNPAIVR